MQLSRGDPMTFIENPISLCFLIAVVVLLMLIVLPNIRRERDAVFAED